MFSMNIVGHQAQRVISVFTIRGPIVPTETCLRCKMTERLYLTPEEVTERFRGAISTGTLANWRAMRVGPAFVKIGKSIVYPVADLNEWTDQQIVRCRATNRLIVKEDEQT